MMYQDRMQAERTVREAEWGRLQLGLDERRAQWNAGMRAIQIRANQEWRRAFREWDTERERWRDDFEQSFREVEDNWSMQYAVFLQRKAAWVNDTAAAAAVAGSADAATQVGIDADQAIAEATDGIEFMLQEFGMQAPDPDEIVGRLTGDLFDRMLDGARTLNRGIRTVRTETHGLLGPDALANAQIMQLVQGFHGEDRQELEDAALLIAALQALDAVAQARDSLRDSVASANDSTSYGLALMLVDAGYRRKSGYYRKEILADATAFKEDYIDAKVPVYQDFALPDDISRQLRFPEYSAEALMAMGGYGMQLVIDEATDRVRLASEAIFGEPGAEDIEVTLSASEKVAYFITRTIEEVRKTDYGPGVETVMREVQEKRYRTVDHKGSATRSPGLFGKHVGFAPQLKDGDDIDVTKARYDFDYNIRFEGEGQMGRIMYAYLNYNLIEARGWSELAKPAWDRRMYNDDGHWISAPTVRQVGMTAVGVAATVASAGVGTGFVGVLASTAISTGVTATGNLAFGMMDVAGGYMDMDDMLLGVGKQAAIGMATGMIGAGSSWASDHVTGWATGAIGGLGGEVVGTIGSTALQGATMLASDVVTDAVQAFDFNKDGQLVYKTAKWEENRSNRWENGAGGFLGAGQISSLAGSFTSGMLAGDTIGFSGVHAAGVQSVAGFGGSLTSMAVDMALTGTTSLNLLNLSDFGFGVNQGLFELSLGSDGIRGAFGGGGHGMNFSRLSSVVGGLDAFGMQQRIRGFDNSGSVEYDESYDGWRSAGRALRTQYSFGDGEALSQLDRLLDGSDVLRIGGLEDGTQGLTSLTADGGRLVQLATLGVRGDTNSQLRAGIVLQHEAYRSGVVGSAAEQRFNTDQAVAGHAAMAWRMAQQFGADFLEGDAAMMESYEAFDHMVTTGDASRLAVHAGRFDASDEYWRLMEDGTIVWDGRRGLYDEDDNLIRLAVDEDGMTLGYGESLLEYMGEDNARQFLASRGTSIDGMSDREIGLALMDTLPLTWTVDDVPIDPNMADLMDRDSINYQTARNAWLGDSYELSVVREGVLLASERGPSLPFFASDDVLAQVAMRDEIIGHMNLYDAVRQLGYGNPEGVQNFLGTLEQRQAEYNERYVNSGMAFTPENFISQTFYNELNRYPLTNGSYISYIHSGIDTVGPNTEVVSPGFLRAVDIPEATQRDNATVLGLVGSDVHFRLLHMNPTQMGQIGANAMYTPGQVIGDYGTWYNVLAHLHLEATRLNDNGTRGFVDPLNTSGTWYPGSDFWGRYEELLPNGLYRTTGGWPSTFPR
ncbi:hypothetical protein Spiaf_1244 [Spirochaeta africana DSM 8902]|uniref:Uncharacterized protein n=2 Tax=Spirochaeta TaxID=146 RepID=H9UIH8_SPIAZ|nr:hypothetical protein Spiaf_1244 [Spirochaeta africana DSM 8902]